MKKNPEEPKQEEIILYRSMDEVMHDSMIPYAEHVILERALPRVHHAGAGALPGQAP